MVRPELVAGKLCPEDAKASRQRYVLIVLLFLHTVNTYMDRVCISAAAEDIQRELALSPQTMGYIFAAFALGYALFQIPAGWMADAIGARKALALVVTAWSAFTMLTGAVSSGWAMLTVRFLFGVGEAGAFPGATRALYSWLPSRERGIAQGIFHSGARVGAALSLFFIPALIHLLGWRWTFVVAGAAGLVWVAVWWLWFRDDPREHALVNAGERRLIEGEKQDAAEAGPQIPLVQIITSWNMLLAMVQYAASNMTFFLSFTWLLPYLRERWGDSAGVYAPVPLLCGTLAHWTSGSLVTWLHARGWLVTSRRLPAIVGFFLGAAGLVLSTQADTVSALPFVVCFSLAVFGVEMTISPSWSFCMDIGGARSGAVSAAMNMIGNFGSAASAMLFPYFVAHVALPGLTLQPKTADSFFAFAAGVNLLGAFCWLGMNPHRRLAEAASAAEIRLKMAAAVGLFALLSAALIYYWLFFGK